MRYSHSFYSIPTEWPNNERGTSFFSGVVDDRFEKANPVWPKRWRVLRLGFIPYQTVSGILIWREVGGSRFRSQFACEIASFQRSSGNLEYVSIVVTIFHNYCMRRSAAPFDFQ